MNKFISSPFTTVQKFQEPIDPDFSVVPPEQEPIDPDFSVLPPGQETIDPDFSVLPPVQDPIDPDFSVVSPVYPIYPIYPNTPPIPCIFCNNNQWIRGAIRLLNAATNYNALTVYIDNRAVYSGLNFSEITQYRRLPQGNHVFSIRDRNGSVYVRKSLFIGDGMATIAIINSPSGLDLISIADTTCPFNNNFTCFRVCNLAYYTGHINVSMGNLLFNAISFKETTSFSQLESGNYNITVSQSIRPETALVTASVTLNPRRIYTLYVLNWNPSAATVQTLLVEDRRN